VSIALADAPASHKIDACDLNDHVMGRIGASGFDVDNAYQGGSVDNSVVLVATVVAP
jgi:hypothetical protein